MNQQAENLLIVFRESPRDDKIFIQIAVRLNIINPNSRVQPWKQLLHEQEARIGLLRAFREAHPERKLSEKKVVNSAARMLMTATQIATVVGKNLDNVDFAK